MTMTLDGYDETESGITIEEELAEQGLRMAEAHESGWYFKVRVWSDDDGAYITGSVWATDNND